MAKAKHRRNPELSSTSGVANVGMLDISLVSHFSDSSTSCLISSDVAH